MCGRESDVQPYDTEHAVASAKIRAGSVVSRTEQVLEGPLWEMQWPFLSPLDVLSMRTSAEKCNHAGQHGPCGELFFLIKKGLDDAGCQHTVLFCMIQCGSWNRLGCWLHPRLWFCRISAGTLPSAARWHTRTRLCWQRKKNGKPRPIQDGRGPALGLRQAARESASGHPPL